MKIMNSIDSLLSSFSMRQYESDSNEKRVFEFEFVEVKRKNDSKLHENLMKAQASYMQLT